MATASELQEQLKKAKRELREAREEIKELKVQLKIEEKEKKNIIAKFKEPKSILDYINKCFTEKSK